jgi:iron complex outermembrane recepter protein
MIVSGLLLLFTAAVADSPGTAVGDTVLLLPEVRVERDRPRTPAELRQPTGFVSNLEARPAGTAVSSLPLALARAAGLRVVQNGGLGAFSTVTLRGAPASQVGVLVDGEPLQSAATSVVSLGDVPAAAIDAIEVYRGAVPLGFGLPAPAGAVNLVTLPRARGFDVRAAGGSFGTWELRGLGGGRRGPFALDVNAGHQESHGDFDYLDDNGTPFNSGDDSTFARRNNAFEANHGIASLRWQAPRAFDVELRQDWFQREQGFPGRGAITTREANESLDRWMTRLTIDRKGERAWPGVHLRAGLRRERSQFADPLGELGWGKIETDDRFSGEHAGAEVRWDQLPFGFAVRGSGSYRVERANVANAADPYADPPQSTREGLGAAIIVEENIADRILLHAARRWDRLDDELHGLGTAGIPFQSDVVREIDTPQLGARVRVISGVELRANWTDAWRAPEFGELFGNQGSVIGNLTLRPEHVRTWDAGGVVHLRRAGGAWLELEYAHFESRGDDMILYRPTQASVRPQNLASVRIEGDEVSLRAAATSWLNATFAWTGQRAIDAGTWAPWIGKQLPGRPGSRIYSRLDGEWSRLGAFVDVDATSLTYLDPSNRTVVPARALVGAGGSWRLTPGVALVLEGRNLGDVRSTDVLGYPLPGRSIYAACEARVGPAP